MPSRQTVQAFIAMVEQGKFVEAIECLDSADAHAQGSSIKSASVH